MVDKGYRLTRFVDDWVVLCNTRNEAVKALNDARQILSKIGLTLHPCLLQNKSTEVCEEFVQNLTA